MFCAAVFGIGRSRAVGYRVPWFSLWFVGPAWAELGAPAVLAWPSSCGEYFDLGRAAGFGALLAISAAVSFDRRQPPCIPLASGGWSPPPRPPAVGLPRLPAPPVRPLPWCGPPPPR